MKKRLVVLSGAGISAESGVKTFRDHNGLWENHDVMEVASIEGWNKNPQLVLDFYNARRTQLTDVEPNQAHIILSDLEKHFEVNIITQNVDNLHERAGSKNIVHLHGELTKVKEINSSDSIEIGYKKIQLGDLGPNGKQLRPDIVWFGEEVPMMEKAIEIVETADILLIVGTSMNVYPAAGLMHYAHQAETIHCINPEAIEMSSEVVFWKQKATEGMESFRGFLLDEYINA